MNEQRRREGLITVLMERFENQQLNRVLGLKRAVAAGERIGDHDRDFLEAVCHQAMQSKRVVDDFPQYQPLFLATVHLYKEITARALENERKTLNLDRAHSNAPVGSAAVRGAAAGLGASPG